MKKNIGIILFFLGISLIITFPLILHFNHFIVANFNDPFGHIWRAEAMRDDYFSFKWFTKTTDLFYPFGTQFSVSFFPFDVYLPHLLFILRLFFSAPAAYNILTLAGIVLTGYSFYLLVFYITRCVYSSLLSASFLILSWSLISELMQGILEQFHFYLVIFFVLCLLKFFQERSRKYLYWAVALTILSALNTPYFLEFELIFAFLAYLYFDANLKRKALVTVALIVVACAASYLLADRETQKTVSIFFLDKDYINKAIATESLFSYYHTEYLLLERIIFNSTDIYNFFHRHPVPPFAAIISFVWGFALFSLFSRTRESRFWFALALIFFFLSLGPFLLYKGRVYAYLPNIAAFYMFPSLLSQKVSRFSMMSALCVCVGAGIFIKSFVMDKSLSPGAKFSLFLVLLFFPFAQLYFFYPGFPKGLLNIDVPNYYVKLRGEKDSGALLHWPLSTSNFMSGKFCYFQTVHKKPIVNQPFTNIEDQTKLLAWGNANAFIRFLCNYRENVNYSMSASDIAELQKYNVRYFVFTNTFDNLPQMPFLSNANRILFFNYKFIDFMRFYFGEPVFSDSDVTVFDINNFKPHDQILAFPLKDRNYQYNPDLDLTLSSYFYDSTKAVAQVRFVPRVIGFWAKVDKSGNDSPPEVVVSCHRAPDPPLEIRTVLNMPRGLWQRYEIDLPAELLANPYHIVMVTVIRPPGRGTMKITLKFLEFAY